MKKAFIFWSLILLLTACMQPYKGLKPMEFSELSYPFPVRYQQLANQINLAYMELGTEGPALIFIHGLGSYAPAWKKNLPELSKIARCFAVDLPGYGKSSKSAYPFTMEFYADVIKEFAAAKQLSRVIIVGHSMGGQIGMVMALKYPQLVSGLVLIDPAGFEAFTPGEKQWFKEVMSVDLVKNTPVQTIRANVVANFYNLPKDAEFMITDRIALRQAGDFEWYCYAVSRSVAGMVDQPVLDKLDKIMQPTLIIFGKNDNLIPNPYLHGGKTEDIARLGKEKIANSQLLLIPNCGHFAQFEKAQEVNKAIKQFLNQWKQD
ncbi:alpha/beta hydrolase fold containing protein [Caldithrix abyssi DSM 13497]|uniref:Alpha/beta hydrolase fold containing protein n=1 Tax=Caldithrix abyssi DSM 13497 TaxID=880073 RepID=H1XYJ6_CALAY|nr:alpha/beta hydrolase [Caldithrix abyssi]EHO39814.1 alpha/beta hydrolase fold containing protein [Caldithrix abyssi DSM 13497]